MSSRNKWQRARRTTVDGIAFPSQMEARVYMRLRDESNNGSTYRLLRQASYPLVNLTGDKDAKPLRFTVDFVLVYPDGRKRYVEAKPSANKARSRDYVVRKSAFEACYNARVEECEY